MTNLELLLGRPIGQLNLADFERLVTERAPESTQLDFKQALYADGQDFAGDVTALANNVGGAIVIGIEETDGVATKLTPIALAEAEVLRMQQWLVSYTAPRLDVEIRVVPSANDPQLGLYVIEVPRSPRAPHALIKGVSLRYYRRSGPRNNPLSEPEIGEAYYSRFAQFRDRAERMKNLSASAASSKYDDDEHAHAWVAVNLLPAYPGSLEISTRSLRAVEEWAARSCKAIARSSSGNTPRATPTMDCISVSTRYSENEPAWGYFLKLYTDGAASVAAQLMPFNRNGEFSDHRRGVPEDGESHEAQRGVLVPERVVRPRPEEIHVARGNYAEAVGSAFRTLELRLLGCSR